MTTPKNNVESWEEEFDETFDLDFWKTFVSSAQIGRGYNLAPIHSFIRNLILTLTLTQSKAQEEREQTHRQELQEAREKTIRDMERKMMGWQGSATAMLRRYRKIIYRNKEEMVELIEHYKDGKLVSRKANGKEMLVNQSELAHPHH